MIKTEKIAIPCGVIKPIYKRLLICCYRISIGCLYSVKIDYIQLFITFSVVCDSFYQCSSLRCHATAFMTSWFRNAKI